MPATACTSATEAGVKGGKGAPAFRRGEGLNFGGQTSAAPRVSCPLYTRAPQLQQFSDATEAKVGKLPRQVDVTI